MGTSPAGWGTPDLATVPSGAILVDSTTTRSLGSRKINPLTRDLTLDASTGRVVGDGDTRHMVQMALHTLKSSSAMRSLGFDSTDMARLSGDFERKLRDRVEAAVAHLVTAGLIEVIGVSQFKSAARDGLREGQVFARFSWRDLTTSQVFQEYL